jgi:dimethylsulfone monooxygenase
VDRRADASAVNAMASARQVLKPKPFGGTRPLIMNAGASPAGRAFALRNCDAFFTSLSSARIMKAGPSGYAASSDIDLIELTAQNVAGIKAEAQAQRREIEVYTQGQVICRRTQKEAEDYYHWANVENAEWPAIDCMLELHNVTAANTAPDVLQSKRRMMTLSGIGGRPYVGTPDKVAEDMATLARAGLRGIAFSFVNFGKDTPFFCAEVLPPCHSCSPIEMTWLLGPPIKPGDGTHIKQSSSSGSPKAPPKSLE